MRNFIHRMHFARRPQDVTQILPGFSLKSQNLPTNSASHKPHERGTCAKGSKRHKKDLKKSLAFLLSSNVTASNSSCSGGKPNITSVQFHISKSDIKLLITHPES